MEISAQNLKIFSYQITPGECPQIIPVHKQTSNVKREVEDGTSDVSRSNILNQVTDVYITLDRRSTYEMSNSEIQPPEILKIKHLSDRGVRFISANASGIFAITDSHELLQSQTNVDEDRNCEVGFKSAIDLLDVIHTSCGLNHTVIIAARGSDFHVLSSGSNLYGQLGLGSIEGTTSFKPVKFPKSQRFIQVETGTNFTFILTDTCDLWGFGHNNHGQLGIDTGTEIVRVPTLVSSLEGIPIISVAAGLYHSLALSNTGLVFASGNNNHGQLGGSSNGITKKFSLVETLSDVFIVFITAHENYSAAIDEFGTVYLWGESWGSSHRTISLQSPEQFVDVALGNDGRFAALSSSNNLYEFGYYSQPGVQMKKIAHVQFPQCPFYRVFSGGDFFCVLAGKDRPIPLLSLQYDCDIKTLLPPSRVNLKDRLRAPLKCLFLASIHLPCLVTLPIAKQVISSVFSSLGLLNGSFLLDKFYENRINIECGIDINSLVGMYDQLLQAPNKVLLQTMISSFTYLLGEIIQKSLPIQKPLCLRFLIFGLLFPSVEQCKDCIDFWKNLVTVIAKLRSSQVLAQWLSEINQSSLRRVLVSLKDFLSALTEETHLYSPIVVTTIDTLEIVWFASTRSKKLPFDVFYHERINKLLDIQAELEAYSSPGNKWCYCKKAPWLLSADTKTRFVRLNSRQLMNQQQAIAMSRAREFWGIDPIVSPLDLYLVLHVDRNRLITDTFLQIASLKSPEVDLKKPLKVVFKGEPGVDAGGVQREFFQLIVEQLFDKEKGIFSQTREFLWFNPNATDPSSHQYLFLAGVVCGLAIYNGNLLNVRFPIALYRKLRGLTVDINDMEEFEPQLVRSLNNILEYTGDVENDMCLTFDYLGTPLFEGGNDLAVTNENRHDYVERVVNHILNNSIILQFDAFKAGFLQSAGSEVLSLFRPEELALLIAGREELDFKALENNTKYEGFCPISATVKAFWRIVHNRLTEEEKKKLLYFVTASPRAPIGGLGTLPFVIARDGEPSHIPSSHTCFFMLVLPDDPNEETLYKKLLIALDNAEGFAFK